MHLHKKQAAAEAAVATETPSAVKPKRKKHKKLIVFLTILVVLGVAAWVFAPKFLASQKNTGSKYTEETVSRRDIVTSLTASGTLEPADSYTVTSLVEGEVLTANFQEGDTVSKDDVLYTIDSSDASTNLTKAKNSLSQAERSYERAQKNLSDLNVKSTASGTVTDIAVSVGDEINAGATIATVRNSGTMTVKLYFPTDEAKTFTVGEAASVTLDGSFETIAGHVTAISGSDEVLSGNRIVRKVTIAVANPGAITSSTSATATVGTSACAQDGTFSYAADKTITAGVNGKVAAIKVAEGDSVSDGQTIVTLSSDSLSDAVDSAKSSVEDAQLSLDNQNDNMDNYTITSPIDGTIIDKEYKQGDSYESGKTLCIIYDMSYLTFTMNIDELDISSVKEGQTVNITADAAEGKTFEGTVTKVSINGTTTNGVTSYPVTVKITDTEGLLPGMNIDAKIVLSERSNVIAVPVEAVSRGNIILVKTGGADAAASGSETTAAADSQTTASGAQAGTESAAAGTARAKSGASASSGGSLKTAPTDAPEGYKYVRVTLGNSDDSYIEVKSGLNEGDTIAYIKASVESSQNNMAGFRRDGSRGGGQDGGQGGGSSGGQGGGSSGDQGGSARSGGSSSGGTGGGNG